MKNWRSGKRSGKSQKHKNFFFNKVTLPRKLKFLYVKKSVCKEFVSMQRIRAVMNRGKMILLTFSDSGETVFKRAVSLFLADELQIEAEQQPVSPSVLSFQGWKYCNISIECCGIGEMCILPVLSMVRLSFLLPVQTGYLRSRKSLKLFGAWKAIAAIQAFECNI